MPSDQTSVYKLFRFTEQELEKNRQGEVSAGQIRRVFFVGGCSLIFFSFIGLGFMMVGLTTWNTAETVTGGLAGFALASVAALAVIGMAVYAYRSVTTARLEVVTGMIDKRVETDPGYSETYVVSIGKHEFEVSQDQYDYFTAGTYTIYVIQHAPQMIISIEP